MNLKVLINTRGDIIHQFIQIEIAINCIISAHFLGKVSPNFVVAVLNNEMSSFGFKKTVLKQILDDKKFGKEFQYLEDLNRIRNIFGHASMELMNDVKVDDPNADIWLSNPKKIGDKVDPTEKSKTFYKTYLTVYKWLIDIGRERGVPFP